MRIIVTTCRKLLDHCGVSLIQQGTGTKTIHVVMALTTGLNNQGNYTGTLTKLKRMVVNAQTNCAHLKFALVVSPSKQATIYTHMRHAVTLVWGQLRIITLILIVACHVHNTMTS